MDGHMVNAAIPTHTCRTVFTERCHHMCKQRGR